MAARPQVHRVQETLTSAQTTHVCANCETVSKVRRRDFSGQAWAVLLAWEEVKKPAVDQPICEDCYNELREVLIDRADEIEAALSAPASAGGSKKPGAAVAKKGKRVGKLAS